jgi:DNA (cytosine-5)-methyltransferase 1
MKIVSLFSGCGGMDLGFIKAGMKVVWANDLYQDAAETYKKNIGDHIVVKSIADIPSEDIPECDGVIGGFPCQGFSLANTSRHVDDTRNFLYREFVRVIRDKAPKFFIAENVKGILSLGKGEIFKRIITDFGECGYEVKYHLFNAADYGVPQKRERVIIFGIKRGLRFTHEHFPPKPTHSKDPKGRMKKWVSIGNALSGLPEPGMEDPRKLPNHTGTKYKIINNGYLGHRLIDPGQPSPTITARGDERGGVVIIHHPNNQRRLTVREAAIVQSFPKGYYFKGNNTSGYRQIGNAVPPRLAEAVANSVLKCLKGSRD